MTDFTIKTETGTRGGETISHVYLDINGQQPRIGEIHAKGRHDEHEDTGHRFVCTASEIPYDDTLRFDSEDATLDSIRAAVREVV